MAPNALTLVSRFALVGSLAIFTLLTSIDFLLGSSTRGILEVYLVVFGLCAIASETLPLTAETSVYPTLPFMKNPRGRTVAYLLIALPLFFSSFRSSTTGSAFALVVAAAANIVTVSVQRNTEKLMYESALEERVYAGL